MATAADYHNHPCATKDCDLPFICTVKYNKERFKSCPIWDGNEECYQCEIGNTPNVRDNEASSNASIST